MFLKQQEQKTRLFVVVPLLQRSRRSSKHCAGTRDVPYYHSLLLRAIMHNSELWIPRDTIMISRRWQNTVSQHWSSNRASLELGTGYILSISTLSPPPYNSCFSMYFLFETESAGWVLKHFVVYLQQFVHQPGEFLMYAAKSVFNIVN